MTALVQSIRRQTQWMPPRVRGLGHRAALVAALVGIVSVVPGGWQLALDALSEAYLSVAVFVAGTLALVFVAERAFKTDLGQWLDRHQRWQVPAATLLGAFPGCGGAIVAVTQYIRGNLSFGAVVATLTATMGDAMFLLLAREPQTAVAVLAISMAIGAVTGYLIDAIHGRDFLRPSSNPAPASECSSEYSVAQAAPRPVNTPVNTTERIWIVLMFPGVIIGVLASFQIDVDEAMTQWSGIAPAHWLGVIGAVLAVAMWASKREDGATCEIGGSCESGQPSLTRSVIDTTNFVTTWVVFAFVAYALLMALSGIDMARVLSVWGPLVPAAAIVVGFIPGCGPQIMVTSLYLAGAAPFSAQIGNAIANDGDALFPALAVAPKAALVATIYSAIPAIIVAYSWYWAFERGVS